MCLTKSHRYPKIARKDILVWKEMNPRGETRAVSTVMNFTYTLGKTYSLLGLFWILKYIFKDSINTGFHSFDFKKTQPLKSGVMYSGYYLCVIPAGSFYFIGKYNDIVSNNIIIKEKLTKKNISDIEWKAQSIQY